MFEPRPSLNLERTEFSYLSGVFLVFYAAIDVRKKDEVKLGEKQTFNHI